MPQFRPPHIYQPNTIYFVTGKTIQGFPYFNTDSKKRIFLDIMKRALEMHNSRIYAFVVHDNHYHILFQVNDTRGLSKFIGNLHRNSARLINQYDNVQGRKVWYQYWDRCIRSERDFWYRFNYIHHNPVKHGYCQTQAEVEMYPWCSFKQWVEIKGKEWAYSVFEMYPSRDFTLEHED